MQDEIKDNGTVQKSATGAVREGKKGKGMYHLIPSCFLESTALTFELGADKRGKRNWELGMPLSWHYDAAFRHLKAIKDGDRSEDHFGRLNFNSAALQQTKLWIEAGRLPADLDDLGICVFSEKSYMETLKNALKPEEEYYYLKEGDVVQNGDEFRTSENEAWRLRYICQKNEVLSPFHYPHRRKIKK